jgi:GT2 family glycosyltransferase
MSCTDRFTAQTGPDSLAADDLRTVASTPRRVDCAVVIVTYNSAQYILRLLDSLPAAAGNLTLRTVVVDNGSRDATVDLVRAYPGVGCIEVGANRGYAGAINIGREHVGAYSSLLVLNPDLVLNPNAIAEMFGALDNREVGMIVPMLLGPDGQCFPSLRRTPTLTRAIGDGLLGSRLSRRPAWLSEMVWDVTAYQSRQSADWATGAILLISAECDRAVGLWDERFFLYSEETDYATRARALGYRLDYIPTARAHHHGGGSGQSDALTALLAISRIRYVEKHGHWPRAFRMAVILHELIRSRNPAHLTALRAVLRRSRWSLLIRDLQVASADTSNNIGSDNVENQLSPHLG